MYMDDEEYLEQRIAKENRRKKQKAERERMPKSGMSLRLIPEIQKRRVEELEETRFPKKARPKKRGRGRR